jgi:hypothetical protein
VIVGIDRDTGHLAELPRRRNLRPGWIDTEGRRVRARLRLGGHDREGKNYQPSWRHDAADYEPDRKTQRWENRGVQRNRSAAVRRPRTRCFDWAVRITSADRPPKIALLTAVFFATVMPTRNPRAPA